MTERYPIPAARHRAEHVVLRSRFIATADHAPSTAAARALLQEMREEFPDARHHVHAFAVGYGASTTHGMSDDGEPAGTAGKPVLTVLRNSGLGDVCVIVTRYFGGTKLGTGGLVKAYTEATQLALEGLERTERVERRCVIVDVPYAAYESVKRLALSCESSVEREDFGAGVRMTLVMARDRVDEFRETVVETTSGAARIEVTKTDV